MEKIYKIYISYSWFYSNAYEKLLNVLNADKMFSYQSYALPRKDYASCQAADDVLYAAIKTQMEKADVVLFLPGVYRFYQPWIDTELEIARGEFSINKKIIAVEPWHAGRSATHALACADRIVRWRTAAIVKAIEELG